MALKDYVELLFRLDIENFVNDVNDFLDVFSKARRGVDEVFGRKLNEKTPSSLSDFFRLGNVTSACPMEE